MSNRNSDDDSEGDSTTSKQIVDSKYDSNVIKKKVKLTPYLPSVEETEPLPTPADTRKKIFKNITLEKIKPGSEPVSIDTNETMDATDEPENEVTKPLAKIKELVKQEENRLEIENKIKKDTIKKKMTGSVAASSDVEKLPAEVDKVSKTVLKLKDIDLAPKVREKPFEKTPDPEVLKLKKVKAPKK